MFTAKLSFYYNLSTYNDRTAAANERIRLAIVSLSGDEYEQLFRSYLFVRARSYLRSWPYGKPTTIDNRTIAAIHRFVPGCLPVKRDYERIREKI